MLTLVCLISGLCDLFRLLLILLGRQRRAVIRNFGLILRLFLGLVCLVLVCGLLILAAELGGRQLILDLGARIHLWLLYDYGLVGGGLGFRLGGCRCFGLVLGAAAGFSLVATSYGGVGGGGLGGLFRLGYFGFHNWGRIGGDVLGVSNRRREAQAHGNCEGDKCFTHNEKISITYLLPHCLLHKFIIYYLTLGGIY